MTGSIISRSHYGGGANLCSTYDELADIKVHTALSAGQP
jgi:hypothetical protein